MPRLTIINKICMIVARRELKIMKSLDYSVVIPIFNESEILTEIWGKFSNNIMEYFRCVGLLLSVVVGRANPYFC